MTFENDIIEQIALDIVKVLVSLEEAHTDSKEYLKSELLHYTQPNEFYVEVFARFSRVLIPERDEHFKNLSWERLNFAKNRFSIDANTLFAKKEGLAPKIVFHFVIDPTTNGHVYREIFSKLLDTVSHEVHHTEQIGPGREPFLSTASSNPKREEAKKSYKYFLLPEEIESMVIGMYTRSKDENIPLDELFDEYLSPFVKDDYITQSEYAEVMKNWIDFALSHYPDALFSKKVANIINQE